MADDDDDGGLSVVVVCIGGVVHARNHAFHPASRRTQHTRHTTTHDSTHAPPPKRTPPVSWLAAPLSQMRLLQLASDGGMLPVMALASNVNAWS